jgi:2-methylcitrate dehydratase PrpD
MNATEEVIRYVLAVRYEDLPVHVLEAVKRMFMNAVAAMLAGSGASGVRETAKLVREWGGKKEATAILQGFKAPAQDAVMVNATMARSLDFDDFHIQTGLHIGATIVPTVLAAAELAGGGNGKEVIVASAVGAELMSRMRMVPDLCIGISGWTGEIFGAFGTAVAAGRILALTEKEMWNALGLAFSQSAGTLQSIYDGTMATCLQQGFAARAGVLSARMALEGITGAREFLEGRAGFYPVYYRGMKYDIRRLIDGLGADYRFLNFATKPYPCCGFILAPIENLMGLMRENHLTIDDVAQIEVRVNDQMYNVVCFPEDAKCKPNSDFDAIWSLPYVLGTVMVRGDVWLQDFTIEAIRDPKRLSASKKVHVIRDKEIDKESKALNLALSLHSMEIRTNDGRKLSRKLYHAKGFPQNPMTLEECAEKARKCAPFAVKVFPEEKVNFLRELIDRIEKMRRITELTSILA